WRQQFHLLADVADLLVNPVLSPAIVCEHAAVELLRTNARLAPEEIQHAGGAPGNRLVGEQPDDARPYQCIDLLPVDVAGLLFDDPETVLAVRRLDPCFLQRAEPVHPAG